MSVALQSAQKIATAASASSCGTIVIDLRKILAVVRTNHPTGTAKWLERATGASPRTVDYWLQGRFLPRGPSALRIVQALRTELEAQRQTLQQLELDLG